MLMPYIGFYFDKLHIFYIYYRPTNSKRPTPPLMLNTTGTIPCYEICQSVPKDCSLCSTQLTRWSHISHMTFSQSVYIQTTSNSSAELTVFSQGGNKNFAREHLCNLPRWFSRKPSEMLSMQTFILHRIYFQNCPTSYISVPAKPGWCLFTSSS